MAAGVLDAEVEVDGDADADDVEADGEMDAGDVEVRGEDEVSRDGDGEAVLLLTSGEDVADGSLAEVESLAAGLLGDEVDGDGEGEGDDVGVADDGRA